MADAPRAHTKIVATLGPASEALVGEMIDAGLSVARVNFSHGDAAQHRRRVDLVRRAAAERGAAIGVLADIQGPKLRLARFPGGRRELAAGERYRLLEGGGLSAAAEIRFGFTGLLASLRPGQRMFLADGAVEIEVESVGGAAPIGVVRRGGAVGDKKGVNLPDTRIDLELPTEKDVEDLRLARELGVDMIGASFVSTAEEVRRIRALAPECLIVAKIERRPALDAIDAILAESDGIMIARGDLGVELELEQLPMAQKALIHAALRAGRFAITATEMLESMVSSSRPTRAEVADVANAVLDGTDAVMLSAETAVGAHPLEAVATMARIARAVESSRRYHELPRVAFRASEPTFSNAIALAAAEVAEALQLARIVCFTETGNSVRLISRYRPGAEIIALSPCERTLNGMSVLSHVRPLRFPRLGSLEEMLASASRALLERRLVQPGEQLAIVAGVPAGVAQSTNVLKLHRVGEDVRLH